MSLCRTHATVEGQRAFYETGQSRGYVPPPKHCRRMNMEVIADAQSHGLAAAVQWKKWKSRLKCRNDWVMEAENK